MVKLEFPEQPDFHYALGKLNEAVHELAVGRGRIKDRLFDAFNAICVLSTRDFPAELQDDFAWVKGELTKKEAKQQALIKGKVVVGVEGRLGASLKGMRLNKAVAIAERICDLKSRMQHIVETRDQM